MIVSTEIYKLAKENGFNIIECSCGGYPSCICTELNTKPTQALLQKWLREIHNIDVVIIPERYKSGINYMIQAQKYDLEKGTLKENFTIDACGWYNDNHDWPTYELALEKGIYEALKLIK